MYTLNDTSIFLDVHVLDWSSRGVTGKRCSITIFSKTQIFKDQKSVNIAKNISDNQHMKHIFPRHTLDAIMVKVLVI